MIQIKNLSKNFRTEEVETIALNGISMEVKKGEFIAIMGPSGCGKSPLLHSLGLLDNPDEGSYLLEGEEVGHLKEKDRTRYRKGRIGFVFQSFNLIDELTVEENVDLQLSANNKYSTSCAKYASANVPNIIRSNSPAASSNVSPSLAPS